MYAGIEGQGAEEAAYCTALLIEHCRLAGQEFTGGAADIHNFVDQVQRDILYGLPEKAGMPTEILRVTTGSLELSTEILKMTTENVRLLFSGNY